MQIRLECNEDANDGHNTVDMQMNVSPSNARRRRMNERMNGCMDGWMLEWTDGWIHSSVALICVVCFGPGTLFRTNVFWNVNRVICSESERMNNCRVGCRHQQQQQKHPNNR